VPPVRLKDAFIGTVQRAQAPEEGASVSESWPVPQGAAAVPPRPATRGWRFSAALLTCSFSVSPFASKRKGDPIVVQDFDRSPLSAGLAPIASSPPTSSRPLPGWARATRWPAGDRSGLAKAAVIIPPGISRRIKAGQAWRLQVLWDGTAPTTPG